MTCALAWVLGQRRLEKMEMDLTHCSLLAREQAVKMVWIKLQ